MRSGRRAAASREGDAELATVVAATVVAAPGDESSWCFVGENKLPPPPLPIVPLAIGLDRDADMDMDMDLELLLAVLAGDLCKCCDGDRNIPRLLGDIGDGSDISCGDERLSDADFSEY